MGYSDKFNKMLGLVTGSNDPELLKSVIEVQQEVSKLEEENRQLRQENHELRNEKILEGDLIYTNSAYQKVSKLGNEEIHYCSKCYDVDKKLVVLRKEIRPYTSYFTFSCPNCKNDYNSNIEHHVDTDIGF